MKSYSAVCGLEGKGHREAFSQRGAGRPQANSGLHKWTADYSSFAAPDCAYFQRQAVLERFRSSQIRGTSIACCFLSKYESGEAYHGAF
jgi:hypothetical protein